MSLFQEKSGKVKVFFFFYEGEEQEHLRRVLKVSAQSLNHVMYLSLHSMVVS
jgi:hypothetical protein